jgi:hypothetical protein
MAVLQLRPALAAHQLAARLLADAQAWHCWCKTFKTLPNWFASRHLLIDICLVCRLQLASGRSAGPGSTHCYLHLPLTLLHVLVCKVSCSCIPACLLRGCVVSRNIVGSISIVLACLLPMLVSLCSFIGTLTAAYVGVTSCCIFNMRMRSANTQMVYTSTFPEQRNS